MCVSVTQFYLYIIPGHMDSLGIIIIIKKSPLTGYLYNTTNNSNLF